MRTKLFIVISILALISMACNFLVPSKPDVVGDAQKRATQTISAFVAGQTATAIDVALQDALATPPLPTAIAPTATPTDKPAIATATPNPTATESLSPVFSATPQNTATPSLIPDSSWIVTFFKGATEQMKGWFTMLKNPAPASWPMFPNVNNPLVDFQAKNGLEYGLDERNYCPQETCDVVVAAGEYNGITADYDFGFLQCSATETTGCGIMFVNVGEVSANFEQVVVDNGFSITGRYWSGNELQQAIWGFVSHVSANMLNMPTTLNPQGSTNAGANCSVRNGCKAVLWRVVIISGNQILVIAETTVRR